MKGTNAMNIKNVLFFSLLFITSIHALPTLDTAKKKLRECKQSNWGGCSQQEKAYNKAKEEFLAEHRENREKGINAVQNHSQKIQASNDSLVSMIPILGSYFKKEAEKVDQQTLMIILKGFGSSAIIDALDGKTQDTYPFSDNDKSITELTNEILEDIMKHKPRCLPGHAMFSEAYINEASLEVISETKKRLQNQIEREIRSKV